MIFASIQEKPLSAEEALAFVDAPQNGAADMFIGRVRNNHQGNDVLGVTYDAHESLSVKTFQNICEEARTHYGQDIRCYISHFKGRLEVGGISVVIAAGSPHREESFTACRFMIEELKKRAPIWKLEHYKSGDSNWLPGHELKVAG